MSSKATVVLGEAPESDSEDEINVSDGVPVLPLSGTAGRVIDGEAPESDEETLASVGGSSVDLSGVSSAASATSFPTSGKKTKHTKEKKDSSLLTKKLCEANVSLAKNIGELVTHTVGNAHNELNTIDQHLLRCQVQVQESADILKTLTSNLTELDHKISSLLSTNYIPDIRIPQSAQVSN